MLDDYRILSNLQDHSNSQSISGALDYLGETPGGGPLGRPISLLTFYFQANSWTSNPENFKRVNVILHAINSVLVFWLLLWLIKRLNHFHSRYNRLVAILIAIAWGINTIHVSTVLYVVQRMTILQAMFSILCILLYLGIRDELVRNNFFNKKAFLTLVLIILTMVLALLSKETGVMTILYIVVMELVCLRRPKECNSKIFSFILALPVLIIITYFIASYETWSVQYQMREFNVAQRTLTQFRILWDYFFAVLFPWTNKFGLFHDDIVISENLFEPGLTFISVVAWSLALCIIVICRAKHRYISFGLCWFLVGHSLESTFLPLELYFEHRNYLPSLGLLIAVWCMLVNVAYNVRSCRKISVLFALLLILLHVRSVTEEVALWGEPIQQALKWLNDRPESFRANRHLTRVLFIKNDHRAFESMNLMAKKWPGEPQTRIDALKVACLYGDQYIRLSSEYPSKASSAITYDMFDSFYALFESYQSSHCKVDIRNRLILLASWMLEHPIASYDREKTQEIFKILREKVRP